MGAIVCKLDVHKKGNYRGYIAMLAVDKEHRRKKIGEYIILCSTHILYILHPLSNVTRCVFAVPP